MNLSALTPARGSVSKRRRIGRGQGSGRGGTSTKGHKGAQSRSGYQRKFGFEGGQQPLQRRVPKFGFYSPNRVEYVPVNIDTLQQLAEKDALLQIDPETLSRLGLTKRNEWVKILGRGELKAKLEVRAHAFSASAKEAIEKAGGSVTIVSRIIPREIAPATIEIPVEQEAPEKTTGEPAREVKDVSAKKAPSKSTPAVKKQKKKSAGKKPVKAKAKAPGKKKIKK